MRKIRQLAAKLAAFQAVAIFSLLYWVLLIPMAVVWRSRGKDSNSGWQRWGERAATLEDLRRQG